MLSGKAQVLALMRSGISARQSAKRIGVSPTTVFRWSKVDPVFGAQYRLALLSEAERPLPDRAELLTLLAEQARQGNVRAIAMLLAIDEQQGTARPTAPGDPFDEVDELARRRVVT